MIESNINNLISIAIHLLYIKMLSGHKKIGSGSRDEVSR